MVAAVRPCLENHRPGKMAPSFNLLPRLARVMGSVHPQLGRQHFRLALFTTSTVRYLTASTVHNYFRSSPETHRLLTQWSPALNRLFSGRVRKLVRLSPETHGLLIRWFVRPSFPRWIIRSWAHRVSDNCLMLPEELSDNYPASTSDKYQD